MGLWWWGCVRSGEVWCGGCWPHGDPQPGELQGVVPLTLDDMEGVCEGAGEMPLPQDPIPAPPMFSGESPGVPETTSEEESLYGALLERLRDEEESESWAAGMPRSQSYTEGSLQDTQRHLLPHAQSHHALLEETQAPPHPQGDSHNCLHVLHTVVACQQEQIGVLQATLRDLAATYTQRERALLAKIAALQREVHQAKLRRDHQVRHPATSPGEVSLADWQVKSV